MFTETIPATSDNQTNLTNKFRRRYVVLWDSHGGDYEDYSSGMRCRVIWYIDTNVLDELVSSALNTEAGGSSETLVTIYQFTSNHR
jgi:hypothetical protein